MQLRTRGGGDTQMLVAMDRGAAQPAPGTAATRIEPPQAGSSPPAKLVELSRHGNHFTVTISETGKPPQVREADVDLPPVLQVGLYLCAHDPDVREQASFDAVRFSTAR